MKLLIAALILALAGCASTSGSRLERDKFTGEYRLVAAEPRCSDVTLTGDPSKRAMPYATVCRVR